MQLSFPTGKTGKRQACPPQTKLELSLSPVACNLGVHMANYQRQARLWLLILATLVLLHCAPASDALPQRQDQSSAANAPEAHHALVLYIHNAWQALTRSMSD